MESTFDYEKWLLELKGKLLDAFQDRILFIGHIGSWVRGEAGPESDIDVNVILDKLSPEDIKTYHQIINEMPDKEKACGCLCTKDEIQAWPRHELFHYMKGCRVLYGSLVGLITEPEDSELVDYLKITTSAMMHYCRHRMIYSPDLKAEVHDLKMAYKSSFFVLQAWIYLKDRIYLLKKKEVLDYLTDELDIQILKASFEWDNLSHDREARPWDYFMNLSDWAAKMLLRADTILQKKN